MSIEQLTEIIIEQLENCIQRNPVYSEIDPKFDGSLRIFNDGVIFYSSNPITLHHPILGIDVYLALENSELCFKKYDVSKPLADITRPTYIPLDDVIDIGPITWSISIPSREVIFVNFFRDEVNPEPENRHSLEFSLNCLNGRRNRADFYAKHNNVGYGQMGNMSIGIYSSDTEILAVDPWFEDVLLGMHGNIEEYIDLMGAPSREEDAWKLDNYLKLHDFKWQGNLSLAMWRFECTDGNVGNFETSKYDDVIRFPINGTALTAHHYYDTPQTEPELGRFCLTRIKIS